jgi:hypothetical protein
LAVSVLNNGFEPMKYNHWSYLDLSTVEVLLFLMFLSAPIITVSGCEGCAIASDSIVVSPAAPEDWKYLEDPVIGFSLHYPADWLIDVQVVATQFAVGAHCRSVRFVEFEPPADSGAAAPMQQSLVQVCAKPLKQDNSLDQYMHRVYGESLRQTFVIMDFGGDFSGTRSYQTKAEGQSKTIFTQNRNILLQITAAVAASPEKLPERQAQVERILGSLALI